jgi:hypothetical protein
MKRLLAALFVTVFIPFGQNMTQPGFYCYAAEVTNGNYIETCVETREDGTQRVCISEYIAGVRIIEVCEELP